MTHERMLMELNRIVEYVEAIGMEVAMEWAEQYGDKWEDNDIHGYAGRFMPTKKGGE